MKKPILPAGIVFLAEGQKDLQSTRPQYAFVPESLLTDRGYNITQYRNKRWAAINCGANKSVGSHIYPDITQVAPKEAASAFLTKLEGYLQKSRGVATPPRKPAAMEKE